MLIKTLSAKIRMQTVSLSSNIDRKPQKVTEVSRTGMICLSRNRSIEFTHSLTIEWLIDVSYDVLFAYQYPFQFRLGWLDICFDRVANRSNLSGWSPDGWKVNIYSILRLIVSSRTEAPWLAQVLWKLILRDLFARKRFPASVRRRPSQF